MKTKVYKKGYLVLKANIYEKMQFQLGSMTHKRWSKWRNG